VISGAIHRFLKPFVVTVYDMKGVEVLQMVSASTRSHELH